MKFKPGDLIIEKEFDRGYADKAKIVSIFYIKDQSFYKMEERFTKQIYDTDTAYIDAYFKKDFATILLNL